MLQIAVACAVTGLCNGAPQAAPIRPTDDRAVLERLPTRPTDPVQRELRDLRRAHEAAPDDVRPALDLARRYFNLALDTGDLRYIGYAEAALAAWRRPGATPPVDVLVMQAQLAQYRHEFSAALKLLDSALGLDSNHVRAFAWRAAVNMVVARYDAVRPDCIRLRELKETLLATGCMAYLDATLGKARAAYETLAAQLKAEPDARPTLKAWTLTVLAEIARRTGDATAAEAHYKSALRLDDSDQFLLAAYAELLTHQRRWHDVVALLRRWERSDVLLLQLARAERAIGSPQAQTHAATLKARFADAALRGDSFNAQDEAWFRLEFQRDAKGALALALKNWAIQKEPRDAEIVLEAALAALDPSSAAPVLEWMARTNLEDPRLEALAKQLKKGSR
ncbi:MAG: hypothetical protein V4637_15020 [Pseudomonadota bacterium]